MLCTMGCIFRMLGSSMIWVCIWLFVQKEDPYLGDILNTRETLFDFLKMCGEKLAEGLVPYTPVTARVGSWQFLTKHVFIYGQLYVAILRVKLRSDLKILILNDNGNPCNIT